MPRRVALPSLLALFVASAGNAQTPEWEPRWIHVGVGGAYSWLVRADDELSGGGFSNETEPSYGGGVTYGVRINAPFSVEVDFEWLEGHAIEQTSVLGVKSDDITMYVLTSNIAFRPINDRILDPFVSIGGGWMRAELRDFGTSGDGAALRFELGTDLWLSDQVGLRLSGRYLFPITTAIQDLDTVGPRVGVFYRF